MGKRSQQNNVECDQSNHWDFNCDSNARVSASPRPMLWVSPEIWKYAVTITFSSTMLCPANGIGARSISPLNFTYKESEERHWPAKMAHPTRRRQKASRKPLLLHTGQSLAGHMYDYTELRAKGCHMQIGSGRATPAYDNVNRHIAGTAACQTRLQQNQTAHGSDMHNTACPPGAVQRTACNSIGTTATLIDIEHKHEAEQHKGGRPCNLSNVVVEGNRRYKKGANNVRICRVAPTHLHMPTCSPSPQQRPKAEAENETPGGQRRSERRN